MKLFDRKYLHCMWSEKIDGKKCLLSDNLSDLIKDVNNGTAFDPEVILACGHVKRSDGVHIMAVDGTTWTYAYFDPNYECKVAYIKGMTVQVRMADGHWEDNPYPRWCDNDEYRVKLEEPVKPKRMTYRQLAEWLAKGNGQYTPLLNKCFISSSMDYDCKLDNDELIEGYKIRYWCSDEWIEPTYEIYEEDCIIKE